MWGKEQTLCYVRTCVYNQTSNLKYGMRSRLWILLSVILFIEHQLPTTWSWLRVDCQCWCWLEAGRPTSMLNVPCSIRNLLLDQAQHEVCSQEFMIISKKLKIRIPAVVCYVNMSERTQSYPVVSASYSYTDWKHLESLVCCHVGKSFTEWYSHTFCEYEFRMQFTAP